MAVQSCMEWIPIFFFFLKKTCQFLSQFKSPENSYFKYKFSIKSFICQFLYQFKSPENSYFKYKYSIKSFTCQFLYQFKSPENSYVKYKFSIKSFTCQFLYGSNRRRAICWLIPGQCSNCMKKRESPWFSDVLRGTKWQYWLETG